VAGFVGVGVGVVIGGIWVEVGVFGIVFCVF
jgi:hypothetical protein